jgi:hypothetical protein
MTRHPNGWVTETIRELAQSPQFKANLAILQRLAILAKSR